MKIKKIACFILIIFSMFVINFKSQAFSVLIDPGHGGRDNGAMSKVAIKLSGDKYKKIHKVYEKKLALLLAKRLYRELKWRGYQTYLTRSIDRTLDLHQRASLAQKLQVDIFISIHLNSSTNREPRGFETYYLSNRKNAAISKIEGIENKNLQGDARSIDKILLDLIIERTSPRSKKLAQAIHSSVYKTMAQSYYLKNRGVKPGLFYVLALTKVPAILLELGFLSNAKEARKLLSYNFQMKYVKAIANGVDKYFKSKKNIVNF